MAKLTFKNFITNIFSSNKKDKKEYKPDSFSEEEYNEILKYVPGAYKIQVLKNDPIYNIRKHLGRIELFFRKQKIGKQYGLSAAVYRNENDAGNPKKSPIFHSDDEFDSLNEIPKLLDKYKSIL